MKPVQLKVKSKFEDLILVLTSWRAFLLHSAPPMRVENTFSYLEISDIDIREHRLVIIDTDSCIYPFKLTSLEDLEQIVVHVTTSIKKVFPDSSPGKLIRKTCPDLKDRFTRIANSVEDFIQNNQGPCGGFSQTYAALCDYNGFILREEVQWDVDNIYHSQNCQEFRLLDFSHLDTSDIALTVASLSFNQWFTKLYCKDFKLRLEISEQILYVISRSLKLEELVLENCGLKCEFAIKMAQGMNNNPGSLLHTINLSGNQLEDRGITAFSRHFEKNHKEIKYLNFSKTSMTSKGMCSLFQCLSSNETICNALRHLDLSGNAGILSTEETNSLYNFLGHCKSLSHLNLSATDCALDSLFGSLVRSCCSSLTYLDVSRNVYSHRKVKDAPPAVAQFFSAASELKHLDLAGTRLPAEALRAIFQGLARNEKIRDLHVNLSDCELQSSGAQVIQDLIVDVPSLCSLDISGNGFDSEMVTLILSVSRSKSLKRVSLGRNFTVRSGNSMADILHRIVQLIQDEDSPVQCLSLADSKLKSGISILLGALGSNSSLTEIDISGNAMGDIGAKLLAKALQINNKLRTVIWDRNNTTASGFLDIAHALEKNYSLRSMPLPLSDICQAYRVNPAKTEEALHQIQSYLIRNNQMEQSLPNKSSVLHEETSSILSQELVNELCMNIQERTEVVSACLGKEAETDLLRAEEAVRDANFTISVLPMLYEAWHSPYKNSKLQRQLEDAIDELSNASAREIQNFTQLILDTAGTLCPKVLQKSGVRGHLVNSVSDRMTQEKNTVLGVNLDHVTQEILNKLSDIKLSITTTIADKVTASVLEDLTAAHSKLEERFPKCLLTLPLIHIENHEELLLTNHKLLNITRSTEEERKTSIKKRNKMLRSIRPTLVHRRACEQAALVQDTEAVAGQMLLLPYSSSSPLKPLPVSIKDAELGGDCCCSSLVSSQPACSLHLMDLPTEGEKLQHYTRQRPRPNRTSRQPPLRAHVQPPESESSDINEREASSKVDEGVEEFFCKKLIQEYHQTPLQVTIEPTTLSSSGSRTFKKKIGEFFALRKPRSSKSLKYEKDHDGSPVAPKGRKQILTDILRPLGKGGETLKSQDKSEDDTASDGKIVLDPTWTPDAARRIKPRYSRELKSQSLILLSGDDEETLGIKQEKKRHCEKADGEVCNTFEHRVHSMLHRIGVTRVLSSEVKKKQNKDGEIKKAGSEGDIVDNSSESPPPALKVRTHSMSTAERVTPKVAEPIRTPIEERLNWKDLGKQLNAELKGRCLELHSSPRRSLVILEHSESAPERKPEDSWSLPGLERSSPAPSPSRIIHLEDTSEAKDTSPEVFGNDEHLLKPRLRLKQFQNRRALSAHEEQLRNQGFTSELESVKIPLVRLQRSPVMKIKQRIEASSSHINSDTNVSSETQGSESCDAGKRPAPTESPLAMKSEGNGTQITIETAQNTTIDQRTEIPSSHSSTEIN